MSEWFVRRDGQAVGPVSTELLLKGIAHGRVPVESEVQRVGTTEWVQIEYVDEFQDALGSDEAMTRVASSPLDAMEEAALDATVVDAPGRRFPPAPAAPPARPGPPPPPSRGPAPPPRAPAPRPPPASASASSAYEEDDDAATRVMAAPSDALPDLGGELGSPASGRMRLVQLPPGTPAAPTEPMASRHPFQLPADPYGQPPAGYGQRVSQQPPPGMQPMQQSLPPPAQPPVAPGPAPAPVGGRSGPGNLPLILLVLVLAVCLGVLIFLLARR